jgi:16S rRNA (cytosine967-C5)-methyltransferase
VPCSGTGTLARNPEIRHLLKEAELQRQAKRQREILAAALGRLAPGGRLVYSTCSLEPEENEAVLTATLADLQGFRQIPVGPLLDTLAAAGRLKDGVGVALFASAAASGSLRTLPGVQPCDGFFAAVIERN